MRHFLTLLDCSPQDLDFIIKRAIELKKSPECIDASLKSMPKVLAMIFEKASTRTRVAFEAAMVGMGGHAIFLSPNDSQLGRGEPVEDASRVISRMVDVVMIRTFEHDKLVKFAEYSKVPVINGLTDDYHPCQLLADMQTFYEQKGSIAGKSVAWIGDGNNMCHSYINAAAQFDFELRVACPSQYQPRADLLERNIKRIKQCQNVEDAVKGADLVVTDVWASMGQEGEQSIREDVFKGYQVTPEVMDLADNEAIFMHCLPAHRGEEVSHEMMDDPRAVVWQEAENRLHAQKSLLEYLLTS